MTKIEEMARAAYEAQAKREKVPGIAGWDALPLMFRFALKQTMRDALAVLREPTLAVIEAAWTGVDPTDMDLVDAWRAQIDAILAEDPAR